MIELNMIEKRNRIPWIFFDLDDTIWNFTENSTIALHKLYEVMPILRKLFPSVDEFIDIYHIHNAEMWQLYGRGEVSTKQLKEERWRRTLATKQFEVLTAVCEELDYKYLDILAQCTAEFEGVKEILDELTKRALLGVLSNGFSGTQYKKLHYSGLEKYITRTIVSEEISINKPNIKIFRYAEDETGSVFPYILVGDNAETDILGALKAGWYAVWINSKGSDFPYSKEYLEKNGIKENQLIGSVRSIKEARPLFEKFFSLIATHR